MRNDARRVAPTLAAVVAALTLAGCSATNVGESWQCPLAQGSSCTSIAEADPAVPVRAARPPVLFGEPLPGARRDHDRPAACDGGCGPLAWLEELFGAGVDAARLASAAPAPVAAADPAAGPGGDASSVASAPAPVASLRVPEVVGRIWIAPFVDADGIYREAHWVRVVLEPASWKLP